MTRLESSLIPLLRNTTLGPETHGMAEKHTVRRDKMKTKTTDLRLGKPTWVVKRVEVSYTSRIITSAVLSKTLTQPNNDSPLFSLPPTWKSARLKSWFTTT
jgi:hypothetical protein